MSNSSTVGKSGKPSSGVTSTPEALRAVGGIRLLRRVGIGAMSKVYMGYDPKGLRTVAVKLLDDNLASHEQYVTRFYREARMSQLLKHKHLVQGYTHGFDKEVRRHYLILEYVDGPTAMALADKNGMLSVGTAVRIGIEIGTALQYLHKRDFVHRDVKPENILIDPTGRAKLADLGLAKRISGDGSLTNYCQHVGTPHYMPYEQAVNGEMVDGRSDLFALGATMYHLLTGRVPFKGETHEELTREKKEDSFLRMSELRSDIPQTLDVLISRSLLRDPRSRFPNVAQFVATLTASGLADEIADEKTPLAPVEVVDFPIEPSSAVAKTRIDLGSATTEPDLSISHEAPTVIMHGKHARRSTHISP